MGENARARTADEHGREHTARQVHEPCLCCRAPGGEGVCHDCLRRRGSCCTTATRVFAQSVDRGHTQASRKPGQMPRQRRACTTQLPRAATGGAALVEGGALSREHVRVEFCLQRCDVRLAAAGAEGAKVFFDAQLDRKLGGRRVQQRTHAHVIDSNAVHAVARVIVCCDRCRKLALEGCKLSIKISRLLSFGSLRLQP